MVAALALGLGGVKLSGTGGVTPPPPLDSGYPRGLFCLWETSSQPSQQGIDTRLAPQGEAEVSPRQPQAPLSQCWLKTRMELGASPCWIWGPWALAGSRVPGSSSGAELGQPSLLGDQGCLDDPCRPGAGGEVAPASSAAKAAFLLNEQPHWQ